MQPHDITEFAKIVNGLAAMKPGAKVTKESLELFWNAMQDWSIDEFRDAANHLARTLEFMPNPYHFEQLRRAGELTAGEAWELALSGNPLEPGSRVARAVQIVGGQYYIRHANVEKELPFIQRRFMEVYAELADVDPVREALPSITAPEHRLTARKCESLAQIANRIQSRREAPAAAEAKPIALPSPSTPKEPMIVVSVRDKIAKLIGVGMSDEDIAKVSGESLEMVQQIRAQISEAA